MGGPRAHTMHDGLRALMRWHDLGWAQASRMRDCFYTIMYTNNSTTQHRDITKIQIYNTRNTLEPNRSLNEDRGELHYLKKKTKEENRVADRMRIGTRSKRFSFLTIWTGSCCALVFSSLTACSSETRPKLT